MNKEEELVLKKFIKKIYDNSFYPATYNIEKNCFEYPEMPNVFYWPSPALLKFDEELYKETINSMLKNFQINTDHYEELHKETINSMLKNFQTNTDHYEELLKTYLLR